MTFEDLPPTVKDAPLTNRQVAARVIDLIISDEDRASGCLAVVVCDEAHRGIQPVVLTDVSHDADVSGLASLLGLLLPVVALRQGSVVVGRGRPRGGVPNDADRQWHQQAIESCRQHGVRLLGFHLATRDGVLALPEPLTQAS